MGDSNLAGPSVPGSGDRRGLSPPTRDLETVVLAPERYQFIDSGLLIDTILNARAPSIRKLYTLKWHLFSSWCEQRHLNPADCLVDSVLDFLQDRLSAGLTPTILKVYV